jgi:hypothetical protein
MEANEAYRRHYARRNSILTNGKWAPAEVLENQAMA